MNLQSIFSAIRANSLNAEIGHKAAAPLLGLGRTTTRYALMAFRTPSFHAAVVNGVLQEAGVVKVLLSMTESARNNVLRIEAKLGRILTRSRAEKIAAAWKRASEASKASVAVVAATHPTCLITPPPSFQRIHVRNPSMPANSPDRAN